MFHFMEHVHPHSLEVLFWILKNLKIFRWDFSSGQIYTEIEGINWGDDRNIEEKKNYFFSLIRFHLIDSDFRFCIEPLKSYGLECIS